MSEAAREECEENQSVSGRAGQPDNQILAETHNSNGMLAAWESNGKLAEGASIRVDEDTDEGVQPQGPQAEGREAEHGMRKRIRCEASCPDR